MSNNGMLNIKVSKNKTSISVLHGKALINSLYWPVTWIYSSAAPQMSQLSNNESNELCRLSRSIFCSES